MSRLFRLQPPAFLVSVAGLLRAIRDDDENAIEKILRLSRRRRILAPLAFAVGALAMLLEGLRMLVGNWRLTLVQVLPATWIWLAMYDLRAHVLHGKSFHVLRGPVLIPVNLLIVAITVTGFFLNAVFAFAIAGPRPPAIQPAFAKARSHIPPIVISGVAVGLALGLSTTVVTRAGRPWFSLSLGVVVGVMMLCYVAVPSRLIGVKPTASRRDKLTASALGTAISATVCTPPYLLGRLGILMLGSPLLRVPGIFVLALGFTLQAGATGAVRAVRLGAALTSGTNVTEPSVQTDAPPS